MKQQIEEIVTSYPYKTYSYFKNFGIPQEQIDNCFLHHIENSSAKGANLVTYEEGKNLYGFAIYTYQDLDTKILGIKTAKIDIVIINQDFLRAQDQLVKKLIDSLRGDRIEYATIRVHSLDLPLIHDLESNGFKSLDSYLIMVKEIDDSTPFQRDSPFSTRNANVEDIAEIQNVIAPAFLYSRFFQDLLIAKESAVEMHRKWIENSIRGVIADHVIVAEYEGKIVGFIALEMEKKLEKYFHEKIGHIPLIGTSPNFRGKHLAKILISEALNGWFKKRKAKFVTVETQLINIPAVRTYEHLGFKLVDSAQTLRWSNKNF